MLPRTLLRRVLALIAVVVLVLTVTGGSSTAQHAVPGPIHAGNTFGWYRNHLIRYEFIGRKAPYWRIHGPGVVRTQHGMLTLNTSRKGSVSATLARQGHAYGRWEIRLRSRRYATSHTNFKVVTELIPAGGRPQHCGGKEIGVENYQLGRNRSKFYIHTLPHNTFRGFRARNLSNDRWHTFAVEVTPTHISWFVDARVINTEHRDAALSGVPMTVRFTMRAIHGHLMNPSRMQMDWLRYWGDRYPSKRSIAAPRTQLTKFPQAC